MNFTLWTILGISLPFISTAIGASFVYFLKKGNGCFQNIALSVSAGIMTAGSFFSLILPALELTSNNIFPGYAVVSISIFCGLIFLFLAEFFVSKKIKNNNFTLISAITLHNLPEGMIVGLAFGLALLSKSQTALTSALSLSIAISIQNIPEGSSVSLPLYAKGYSKNKAFFYGMLSGIVEPIGAILSLLLVNLVNSVLPILLAFSAGCMIFVVVKELVPESQKANQTISTIFFFIGFILMLILDNALN